MNIDKETTKQVTPPQLRNPSGKGGFGDNPQNRNDGRWRAEDSISYQYKKFMRMTPTELKEYAKVSDDERTVAQDLAYKRIIAAQRSLNDMKEVTDRTEGRPQQYFDHTTDGEKIEGLTLKNMTTEELQALLEQSIRNKT